MADARRDSQVILSGKAGAAVRQIERTKEPIMTHQQKRVRAVVHCQMFDYISALLVITNSVAIGIQTEYNARELLQVRATGFCILDIVFCIIFAAELLLRMFADGTRFFCVPEWKWNTFDCCLVGLQVFDEILSTVASGKDRIHARP